VRHTSTRDSSRLTDEELLAAYQRADTAAFEEFFRRHKRLIYSFLYSKLGTKWDAEEAFQKTFLKIHRYILKYDPTQSALGWVITIARNVAWDLKPKQMAPANIDEVSSIELSIDHEAVLEARKTLEELVRQLAPKEQNLIERLCQFNCVKFGKLGRT
jgi:RNA polymerase sigma factor (sigma-70 family)